MNNTIITTISFDDFIDKCIEFLSQDSDEKIIPMDNSLELSVGYYCLNKKMIISCPIRYLVNTTKNKDKYYFIKKLFRDNEGRNLLCQALNAGCTNPNEIADYIKRYNNLSSFK